MRIALIGFGQAGGKIVDRFIQYDKKHGSSLVMHAIAVNTAKADLLGLEHVPRDNRVLIGKDRVKGHGVGADNELGAEIAERDIHEVLGELDNAPMHKIDAFVIVAGLGGGTGSGGAPVLAKHLDDIYSEPIYGIGVLPAQDEGGIYTLNAARSFQTFVRECDALLGFDNDVWRESGQSVEQGYKSINDELMNRFGPLFSAGEVDAGDNVAESVVDSSEIINTFGTNSVVSIGYASTDIPDVERGGLLSKLTGGGSESLVDETESTNRITSLVRKAARGRLTLPCNVDSVERALLLVSGPPEFLNRKGIERGRKFLEEETGSMEVRGGDNPVPNANKVAATVVLAGVSDIPRVKGLQQVAIEAQENINEIQSNSDEKLDDLVQDGNDEIESLF